MKSIAYEIVTFNALHVIAIITLFLIRSRHGASFLIRSLLVYTCIPYILCNGYTVILLYYYTVILLRSYTTIHTYTIVYICLLGILVYTALLRCCVYNGIPGYTAAIHKCTYLHMCICAGE